MGSAEDSRHDAPCDRSRSRELRKSGDALSGSHVLGRHKIIVFKLRISSYLLMTSYVFIVHETPTLTSSKFIKQVGNEQ